MIAALAHNLLRWTHVIALPDQTVRTARSLRRRLLNVPGRLTRHGRGTLLRMPARWPGHRTSSPRSHAYARCRHPPDPPGTLHDDQQHDRRSRPARDSSD